MRARPTLIAATIAGLLAGAGAAHAIDRPAPQAAKSCPQHGPGFVEIPGTTTCIRIGGRVRSEYQVTGGRARTTTASGLRSAGQVSVDTRSDTAYGPIRTFVRVRGGQVTDAFVQTR